MFIIDYLSRSGESSIYLVWDKTYTLLWKLNTDPTICSYSNFHQKRKEGTVTEVVGGNWERQKQKYGIEHLIWVK